MNTGQGCFGLKTIKCGSCEGPPCGYEELAKKIAGRNPAHGGQPMMDGAACWSRWRDAKVRILFYYKETYGYQGAGVEYFGAEFVGWTGNRIRTTCKQAAFAWAVLRQINDGEIVDEGRIWCAFRDSQILKEAAQGVALVNINKFSGTPRSDDKKIRELSRHYAVLLRKQIELLDPHIIVCGGQVAWDSLVQDTGLFPESLAVEANKIPIHKVGVAGKMLLCHFFHFARLGVCKQVLQYSHLTAQAWNSMNGVGAHAGSPGGGSSPSFR
jgi:hypothetical protein